MGISRHTRVRRKKEKKRVKARKKKRVNGGNYLKAGWRVQHDECGVVIDGLVGRVTVVVLVCAGAGAGACACAYAYAQRQSQKAKSKWRRVDV